MARPHGQPWRPTQSWPVGGDFFYSFSPLSGGALVLILALGLSFAMASVEAQWEQRLLEVLGEGWWPWAVRAGTPVDATRASVQSKACIDGQSARSGC